MRLDGKQVTVEGDFEIDEHNGKEVGVVTLLAEDESVYVATYPLNREDEPNFKRKPLLWECVAEPGE